MRKIIKLGVAVLFSALLYLIWWNMTHYSVTKSEYHTPPPEGKFTFKDDLLNDKNPVFDPDLVDSHPLGKWELNNSAAVFKLDCPIIKPDLEKELLVLHPSYSEAIKNKVSILPSANLLDGKAKQFDDGLYAALDLACFQGKLGFAPSAPDFVQKIFDRLPKKSQFRPFLAAALKLCDRQIELTPEEKLKEKYYLTTFEINNAKSKPLGFYNWTDELKKIWKFFKFLQYRFNSKDLPELLKVSDIIKNDSQLLKEYSDINAFYGKLTNPFISLRLDQLEHGMPLSQLAKKYRVRNANVCFFPPSTSRETELFYKLFDDNLPPEVNLINALITKIRSGMVKLKPKANEGWYQYQLYALEVLLFPSKGEENNKLLLTANYKKRLFEAFKALITKRRETHSRQLYLEPKCGVTFKPKKFEIYPRLRVEPCATYYLRTARSYAFLYNFLSAVIGEDKLHLLKGLKAGGERENNLQDELKYMRDLFYGLYLVSCEDIGLKPSLTSKEMVDNKNCMADALTWLDNYKTDPDLSCDTRISVPVFLNLEREKTRMWATIGVRLAKLNVSYVKYPKVRLFKSKGEWQSLKESQINTSCYLIPVDEFVEFEISGFKSITRKELHAICDQFKTKNNILKALKNYSRRE